MKKEEGKEAIGKGEERQRGHSIGVVLKLEIPGWSPVA